MKRTRRLFVSVLAVVVLLCGLAAGSASAGPTQSQPAGDDHLDAYTAVVQADQLSAIAEQGIEVSGQRQVADGIELDMVLDQAQANRLRGRGVDLKLTRVKGGLTVQEFAAEQAANGL